MSVQQKMSVQQQFYVKFTQLNERREKYSTTKLSNKI